MISFYHFLRLLRVKDFKKSDHLLITYQIAKIEGMKISCTFTLNTEQIQFIKEKNFELTYIKKLHDMLNAQDDSDDSDEEYEIVESASAASSNAASGANSSKVVSSKTSNTTIPEFYKLYIAVTAVNVNVTDFIRFIKENGGPQAEASIKKLWRDKQPKSW